MNLQPEATPPDIPSTLEFAEPSVPQTLELSQVKLKQTPEVLPDLLLEPLERELEEAPSLGVIEFLQELNWDVIRSVSDRDLRPARIQVGLTFVGFGSLMLVFLLLYIYGVHPELRALEHIGSYWYPYIWFVSLGVSGLFMLGRESMRPPIPFEPTPDESHPE